MAAVPTVWIYSTPHQDGPVRMIRAAATAEIIQRDDRNGVWVNGTDVVWGIAGAKLPPGFALALAQALNAARHAAEEHGHDQVVTARVEDGQPVWKVYPVDEVPESPTPKPELPSVPDQSTPPSWGKPPLLTPGGYPPNPADL